MAKTYETTADWREIPADMLSDEARNLYNAYKARQREAAELRENFEAAFAAMVQLPAGKRYGFGYRFGKLSVAVLDDDRKAKPAAKPAPLSLADLLGVRSI